MPDNDTRIKLPVRVLTIQVYGGDVRTMSGGWEQGYCHDEFAVLDADAQEISRGKSKANAEAIADSLNNSADLEAKLAEVEAERDAYAAMLDHTNDLRAFNWHIQRRRENNHFEWLSTKGDSVFGPFETILEAYAAASGEK